MSENAHLRIFARPYLRGQLIPTITSPREATMLRRRLSLLALSLAAAALAACTSPTGPTTVHNDCQVSNGSSICH
jgi:hypothetical protein